MFYRRLLQHFTNYRRIKKKRLSRSHEIGPGYALIHRVEDRDESRPELCETDGAHFYEATKRFLAYRVVNRRSDYFDHRSNRHPKPLESPHARQRGLGRLVHTLGQHFADRILLRLSLGRLCSGPRGSRRRRRVTVPGLCYSFMLYRSESCKRHKEWIHLYLRCGYVDYTIAALQNQRRSCFTRHFGPAPFLLERIQRHAV